MIYRDSAVNIQKETFINDDCDTTNSSVTKSSMKTLLEGLKRREDVEVICKQNHLNKNLLLKTVIASMHGYNNTDVARRLKVHRVTIQRYSDALKRLGKDEFDVLCDYVLKNGQWETE
jgi:fumarate hydratase class II